MKLRWLVVKNSDGTKDAPRLQQYDRINGIWEDVPELTATFPLTDEELQDPDKDSN